jgi:predicted kinase
VPGHSCDAAGKHLSYRSGSTELPFIIYHTSTLPNDTDHSGYPLRLRESIDIPVVCSVSNSIAYERVPMSTLPALIVVCGAPGSGKTTLARRLAQDLRLPLLEKDVIKEALAETLDAPDRKASRQIGGASVSVMFALACESLHSGTSVMIESNFLLRFATDDLARMTRLGAVHLVQCSTSADIIEARYLQRAADGARHAIHFDLDALPDLQSNLDRGEYDLTSLPYPSVLVDTADGYAPSYPAIIESLGQGIS